MKRLLTFLVLSLALVAGRAAPATADTTVLCSATMWAGQKTNAGTVTVLRDGTNILVRYKTTGAWTISQVHVHLAASLTAVPQNSGGPIPGQFAFQAAPSNVTTYTMTIPATKIPKGASIVLAHAVVTSGTGTVDCTTELTLPTNVVNVSYLAGTTTYMDILLADAGAFNGIHHAWCVDLGVPTGGTTETARLISSLDPAASFLVDRPENIDVVNFILNQSYSGWTGVTKTEIQAAIWSVIDAAGWQDGVGFELDEVDADLVDDIVSQALSLGQGFVPTAGQLAAIFVVNSNGFQTVMFPTRVGTCGTGSSETAWAGNLAFPGNNWARYFTCPKLVK